MRPAHRHRCCRNRPQWLGIVGCLGLAAVGCGRSAPLKTVPVTGHVLYRDGSLITSPRLEIVFIPQQHAAEDGTGARVARARVNSQDGSFAGLTTWSPGDGAVVGKNKVLVIARNARGEPDPAVPSAYASPRTTPLVVELADNSQPLTIHVERAAERRP